MRPLVRNERILIYFALILVAAAAIFLAIRSFTCPDFSVGDAKDLSLESLPPRVQEAFTRGVVGVEGLRGGGTGFVIEKNIVLTCNHVVEKAAPESMGYLSPSGVFERFLYVFDGDEMRLARVENTDEENDLAILRVLPSVGKFSKEPLSFSNKLDGLNELSGKNFYSFYFFPDRKMFVEHDRFDGYSTFYSGRGRRGGILGKMARYGFSGSPVLDEDGNVIGVVFHIQCYLGCGITGFIPKDQIIEFLKKSGIKPRLSLFVFSICLIKSSSDMVRAGFWQLRKEMK